MQNLICLVLGKSGTGKSYFTRHLIVEYLEKKKRKHHIVIDLSPDHFYSGLKEKGFKLTEIDRNNVKINIDWEKVLSIYPNVVLEVVDLLDEEIIYLLDGLGKDLFKIGDTLLVIDEAHQFFKRFHYSEELARLFRGGRKYYIDIVMVTQMITDLEMIARKQANTIVSFQITEENDVKKVSSLFGVDETVLRGLGEYQFLVKNLRTGEQRLDKLW